VEALTQLTDEEFEQIEEAIGRSTKGRAFLRRLHRRSMGAASEEIRSMLVEFRQSWQDQTEAMEVAKHADVLRRELQEMAASIEQARREVAALRPPDGNKDKIVTATSELDAIVISTERASFEILNAAEKLMEHTGRLRAEGADAELCGHIENEVNNIFTACSFQDLTGQRTSKVVNALRYIEQRINAMMSIWGEEGLRGIKPVADSHTDTRPDAHLLNGPQLEGLGVSQADVDNMFDAPAAIPMPAPAPASSPQSQADIDSLFDTPAPAAHSGPASQADIDNLFDAPAPPPPANPTATAKPPAKPPTPAKAAAKPVKAAPPPPEEEIVPLDQSAIDALFG
jgi:chemotaxis regulatin CheY-phosphate phosphatase CheZ